MVRLRRTPVCRPLLRSMDRTGAHDGRSGRSGASPQQTPHKRLTYVKQHAKLATTSTRVTERSKTMATKPRVRCYTFGVACYYVLSCGAVFRVYTDEAGTDYLKTWADIAYWGEKVPWVGY